MFALQTEAHDDGGYCEEDDDLSPWKYSPFEKSSLKDLAVCHAVEWNKGDKT